MSDPVYEFRGDLWLYPGEAGWHFITLPTGVADAIDAAVGERGGFGSIPVEVTIGATTWRTSLFPDRKAGSFLLPVKQKVRAREGLAAGDTAAVTLRHDMGRE